MLSWRSLATQLALFGDPPPKHTVTRPARRFGPPPVERVLLDLAPYLPADAEPRPYAEGVEIPLARGHVLERLLRRLGFRRRSKPFDFVKPKTVKGQPRQSVIDVPTTARWFWQLEGGRR